MTCLEAASRDFSDLPSPPAAYCIAHLSQIKARCFSVKADPSYLRMTFTGCCFSPLQWLASLFQPQPIQAIPRACCCSSQDWLWCSEASPQWFLTARALLSFLACHSTAYSSQFESSGGTPIPFHKDQLKSKACVFQSKPAQSTNWSYRVIA